MNRQVSEVHPRLTEAFNTIEEILEGPEGRKIATVLGEQLATTLGKHGETEFDIMDGSVNVAGLAKIALRALHSGADLALSKERWGLM